jgi:hypothetical protein
MQIRSTQGHLLLRQPLLPPASPLRPQQQYRRGRPPPQTAAARHAVCALQQRTSCSRLPLLPRRTSRITPSAQWRPRRLRPTRRCLGPSLHHASSSRRSRVPPPLPPPPGRHVMLLMRSSKDWRQRLMRRGKSSRSAKLAAPGSLCRGVAQARLPARHELSERRSTVTTRATPCFCPARLRVPYLRPSRRWSPRWCAAVGAAFVFASTAWSALKARLLLYLAGTTFR